MKLIQILSSFHLFIIPILAQDLIPRLNALGLNSFAQLLTANNPNLVEIVSRSNDVTVWAPGNAQVAAQLAKNAKRDSNPSDTAGMLTKTPPAPVDEKDPSKRKRQTGEGPPGVPDSNFETIYTFLDDPEFVNLGPGQVARYVKNYASPLDGGATSLSPQDVTSGLGQVHHTLRGPFKFANGVIYEVNDFFTPPQPFTQTFQQLNLAREFYDRVVSTGNLRFFEETPAVTIFAPIDSFVTSQSNSSADNSDPKSHIFTGKLGYSPQLKPGKTYLADSGAPLVITFAENGERLVNCRRLLKANVITKNGVVHFIDGPLFGGCDNHSNTSPSGNATTTQRPPIATVTGASPSVLGAPGLTKLAAAFAAGLLAFHVY